MTLTLRQKPKALGMSGRQANYMTPTSEFDESGNAIKNHGHTAVLAD
jgi:hypothetical protein